MSSDVMFVLIYILFVICIVHPPVEVVSAGFTIPVLFEKFLGNENVEFVQYHIRRTALTLLLYSLLPLLFIIGINTFVTEETAALVVLIKTHPTVYLIATTVAIGLPILAIIQIYIYKQDWSNHPIVNTLKRFSNANTSWDVIVTDINNEFRRIEKICIKTSPITTVIATENWIIKVLPLNVFIAHQSDASLTVQHSDTHSFSIENPGTSQYITIEVKSNRVASFQLRLNALDFQDIQDRVTRSITILPEVKFHRSVIEKFTDAFKDAIKDNTRYNNTDDLELCIGCMQNSSNIKLQKYCSDTASESNCSSCYCKPMWCVDCLANWFAHRQDITKSDTWLSSKCTCPTCRATFCILDVCPIDINENVH